MSSFLTEAAFSLDVATCYVWRLNKQRSWQCAPKKKAVPLLAFLGDNGKFYQKWAEHYYEIDVCEKSVRQVFESIAKGSEIEESVIRRLNPDFDASEISEDCEEIGVKIS